MVRLQLLPCSLLTGQKIWSSRIAVAILQPSCWACRQKIWSSRIAVAILQPSYWGLPPKNLESTDCSCYPAALMLGLPQKTRSSQIAVAILQPSCWACRQKSGVVRLQLLPCSMLTGPAAKKSGVVNAAATLQHAYCACRQKIWVVNAVATLQLAYWACRKHRLFWR